jgi:hypothetical protein
MTTVRTMRCAREDKEEIFERAAPRAGEGVPAEMGEGGEAAQVEYLFEIPDAAADDEPPEPPKKARWTKAALPPWAML